MSGGRVSGLEMVKARLGEDVGMDGRETYLPGQYKNDGDVLTVHPIGNQSSGNLFALVQGNCLIKISPGVQSLKQDSLVEIWKFA
jgi:molybdopterin biosynthesis enzyme